MVRPTLDESVKNRYSELLGDNVPKEEEISHASFVVEGTIYDPWLEDLEWQFLNDLQEDYQGIKEDEKNSKIHFLFLDEVARSKALSIIETRFEDIKPKIIGS